MKLYKEERVSKEGKVYIQIYTKIVYLGKEIKIPVQIVDYMARQFVIEAIEIEDNL